MAQTQPNKILVIEDEELIRESILHLLNTRGFNAIGAADGSIGVRLAKEFVPDLILCDVRMPGLDGYEVLKALRSDPITATVPFIFLTAQAIQAELYEGQQLVSDGYLAKPFAVDALLEAIARCLSEDTDA